MDRGARRLEPETGVGYRESCHARQSLHGIGAEAPPNRVGARFRRTLGLAGGFRLSRAVNSARLFKCADRHGKSSRGYIASGMTSLFNRRIRSGLPTWAQITSARYVERLTPCSAAAASTA